MSIRTKLLRKALKRFSKSKTTKRLVSKKAMSGAQRRALKKAVKASAIARSRKASLRATVKLSTRRAVSNKQLRKLIATSQNDALLKISKQKTIKGLKNVSKKDVAKLQKMAMRAYGQNNTIYGKINNFQATSAFARTKTQDKVLGLYTAAVAGGAGFVGLLQVKNSRKMGAKAKAKPIIKIRKYKKAKSQ